MSHAERLALTPTRTAPRFAGAQDRIRSALKAFDAWLDARGERRLLAGLSAAQLADAGIARELIAPPHPVVAVERATMARLMSQG